MVIAIFVLIICVTVAWVLFSKPNELKSTPQNKNNVDEIKNSKTSDYEDDEFGFLNNLNDYNQKILNVTTAFRKQYFINGLTSVQNLITKNHLSPIKITIEFKENETKDYEAIVDLFANPNKSPRIRPGLDFKRIHRNYIGNGIKKLLELYPNLEQYKITINDETHCLIEPIF